VRRVVGSAWLFLAALAVLAGAAVALAPGNAGAAGRIAHLESLVQCPACADLSVAQSNNTTAIGVRKLIAREVRAGQSDTEILTGLENTYGPQILLSPRGSILDDLLWVVPVTVIVVGAGLFVRLVRRRR
jgi:cytochrome c-type biogenesis protein CcmH/NrfF